MTYDLGKPVLQLNLTPETSLTDLVGPYSFLLYSNSDSDNDEESTEFEEKAESDNTESLSVIPEEESGYELPHLKLLK